MKQPKRIQLGLIELQKELTLQKAIRFSSIRTYILEDFIEGGSHRDKLDEATKERIDTAYKEMNGTCRVEVVDDHPKGDMMTIKLINRHGWNLLLDPRGQLDLPLLGKDFRSAGSKGYPFVIATGNEVHRMRQLLEHLASRVVLVVANGAYF